MSSEFAETLIADNEDFDFDGDRGNSPFYVHMIAGSMAGLMEHVAIFPMDTIKTHMQTSTRNWGFKKTLHNIYKNGGFARFWKGWFLIGSASVPAHSLYFSIYEYMKGFQFIASGLTGACATLFHDLILTPADSKFKLMNAPYAITTVMVNENLKKVVEPKKKKYKFLSYFFCAAIAGSIASFITCPMDNIKTRLQTQSIKSSCEKIECINQELDKQLNSMKINEFNSLNENSKKNLNAAANKDSLVAEIKYKNIFSTTKAIYQENGFVKGFFRGLTPRVLSNSPSCAISWGTYEFVKHFLTQKFSNNS